METEDGFFFDEDSDGEMTTPEERQVKMKAMLAEMKTPQYKKDVDVAEAIIDRVRIAKENYKISLDELQALESIAKKEN